jgi:hypothetical protein
MPTGTSIGRSSTEDDILDVIRFSGQVQVVSRLEILTARDDLINMSVGAAGKEEFVS